MVKTARGRPGQCEQPGVPDGSPTRGAGAQALGRLRLLFLGKSAARSAVNRWEYKQALAQGANAARGRFTCYATEVLQVCFFIPRTNPGKL